MNKTSNIKILFVTLCVALSPTSVTWAQGVLEEVVVTAERRTENLQDVPITINAFTSDMVEKQRIHDFQDLGIAIPGFSINTFTKSRLNPSLRGGSSSLAGAGAEGAVGLFIDDLYFGGPGDFEIDMWDVERIEVLRGPQGTLFGRNTTGGSINVVTKNPTEETEAKVEVTYGNFDLLQIRGLVSGQLADNLYGLVTFQNTDRDGTSFNQVTGNRVDTTNKSSLRGKLRWELDNDLEVILSASFSRHDETGIARDQQNFPVGVALDHTDLTTFTPEQNDPRVTTQFSDGRYDSEQYTLGLRISKGLDMGELLSISSGRYFDSNHAPASLTGAPIPIFAFGEPRTVRTFSQEFRFVSELDGPLNFVSGLYFYHSDENRTVNSTVDWNRGTFAGVFQAATFCPTQLDADTDAGVITPSCFGPGLVTVGNHTGTLDSLYEASRYTVFDNVKTTSYAVFTEAKYDLTEDITLTAGGRWTHDNKELDGGTRGAPDFVWNTVPGSIYVNDESWSEFTYRFGVDWKATDSILLFGTSSKGFRSGAYDVTQGNAAGANLPLNPEKVFSHEIGIKSRWMDDRVQLNVTAFHTTYEDLQFFVTSTTTASGVIVSNAGEATVKGIEIDLIAALSDAFTFRFQFSHQDGDSENIPAETEIPEGTPPQGTVPYTYIASLEYDVETANGGNFNASIDVTKKEEWGLEFSAAPQFNSEVDALVNARASYEFPKGHWSVTAWVKNLLDEEIVTYGQDFAFPFYSFASFGAVPAVGNAGQPRYTDPRTFGVTLGYQF